MTDIQNECFLCGNIANSKEHIIPHWLQKEYDLQNQKLGLWNKTNLLYRNAVLPLCKKCNSVLLGQLEKKIQTSIASEIEYFLWALKICFFLSIKDTTIYLDRKDRTKGKLMDKNVALIGYEFVKQSLNSLKTNNFFFTPNPFGTVLLFDNHLEDEEFGFISVPNPFWGLTISLPNRKILSILFTDRGLVKNEILKEYKSKGGLNNYCNKLPATSTNELVRQIMLKLFLMQYQIENIPYGYTASENEIQSIALPQKINYRKKIEKEAIINISRTVQMDETFGTELYNSLPESYRE